MSSQNTTLFSLSQAMFFILRALNSKPHIIIMSAGSFKHFGANEIFGGRGTKPKKIMDCLWTELSPPQNCSII